jgi:hypothetical protein
MATTIIHFGHDLCSRIPVFQSAGFRVDVCVSVDLLVAALEHQQPDAVAVSEQPGIKINNVVTATRSCCSSPVILFECREGQQYEANFDLVVPVLTPPWEWLNEITSLIARSKILQREAQELRAQTSALRSESGAARQRSAAQQERARELRKKFPQSD